MPFRVGTPPAGAVERRREISLSSIGGRVVVTARLTFDAAGRSLEIRGTPLPPGTRSAAPAKIETPGLASAWLLSMAFYVQGDPEDDPPYTSAELLGVVRSLTPAADLDDPATW